MKTSKAIELILEFKGVSLKERLSEIKSNTIGNTKARISSFDELFDAAMAVKLASAQINEIVHAVGIIKTLPIILDDDEIITNLSLASGAEGSGFDLETNKRVAEFKFAKWQDGSANGMRKRQVFSDLANLTILKTDKKKELYVVSYDKVIRYLNGKANWTNALSKSGNIKLKLGLFLNEINRPEIKTINEIVEISDVEIFDVENILKTQAPKQITSL